MSVAVRTALLRRLAGQTAPRGAAAEAGASWGGGGWGGWGEGGGGALRDAQVGLVVVVPHHGQHQKQQSASVHFQPPGCGLFGVQGLRAPRDFPAVVQDAVETCQEIVRRVGEMPPSPAVVDAVDEISNTICQVLDPAELCRNVATSSEWRAAATQACIDMESYVQVLNSEPGLHRALSRTIEASEREQQRQREQGQGQEQGQGGVSGLWESREQEAVARALDRDFLLGGVHLPESGRRRVADLKQRIQLLGMEFTEALSDPDQLGRMELRRIQGSSAARGSSFPLDAPHLSYVLQHSKDDSVRREAYMKGYGSPAANLGRLHEMTRCRHELANLTGFGSFASYTIQPYSLAKTPETVWSFLTELSEELRPLGQEEMRLLEKAAGKQGIRPWDQQFLMSRVREQHFQVDPGSIAAYLPLEACLKGLGTVSEAVLGLRLVEQRLPPEESWAPGVRKLILSEESGQEIGVMYLDAERRPNKCPHAAHFNIRSGRRLPPVTPSGEPRYQMPVVALVCNFEAGRGLTLSELETLFHEFGHAMHSLLSSTCYQHLAGTRGALDCIEVPSHLWQSFASDPVVLQAVAAHAGSGPIHPAAISELRRSRAMFSFMDMQQQVVYSLMDQVLHGPTPPSTPEGSTQVLAELMDEHMGVKLEPGVHPQGRFSHFVGYGGSYYSYLVARSVASSAWRLHFAPSSSSSSPGGSSSRPLCREGGDAVRGALLAPGGLMSFPDDGAPGPMLSFDAGTGGYRHILDEILQEKESGGLTPLLP